MTGRRPSVPQVTWLGHATVVIDLDGVRLLTDPVLGTRVGPLRRRSAPPPAPGRVDGVLISHAHHDHLDLPSLRRLPGGPPALVAPGTARMVSRATGGAARELAPGRDARIGGLAVRAVQAAHAGTRFGRRSAGTPVGFVVEGSRRIYFAGDTDLFDGMRDLGPLDLALLPVWGWGPSVGAGHLDPVRAAEAVRRLRPRLAVPIHWGTLGLPLRRRAGPEELRRPADAFAALVRRGSPDVQVAVPRPGQPIGLP